MDRVKRRVDALILERLLPKASPVREIDQLYRMMRDYPSRPAKGLRPLFCVTACKAFGGNEENALLAAAAIELLHNWVLIHDDIEDGSELRRGEPVLHRKYDESLAINAGDALHARMWGALVDSHRALGAATTLRVLEEFSQMINETTEGQHMELVWILGKRWDLDETAYIAMVRRKTAWYTVAGPCRLGAVIAGADAPALEMLSEFGLRLGVGFQIQDDALNLRGASAAYGKVHADDIVEGKRTLILLALLEQLAGAEQIRVRTILDKDRAEKTDADVRYVLSLIQEHGLVDYAQRKAHAFLADALTVLDRVDWSGDGDSARRMREVATFAIDRTW
jgi:geranylgeranyl diphosphate synthase type II